MKKSSPLSFVQVMVIGSTLMFLCLVLINCAPTWKPTAHFPSQKVFKAIADIDPVYATALLDAQCQISNHNGKECKMLCSSFKDGVCIGLEIKLVK